MCLPQVLYCCNTTPHQSTGESPFILMFGQEPQLPIDFLLWRVESPVGGSIHEWVREHQAHLQVAFEGARDRLKNAADRRKRAHDQYVRDLPLPEGQLVFLWDFTARGPHKIRDWWSSVKYRVIRTPDEGGSVYTIVPVNDETKVRRVHRTMLKTIMGKDLPNPVSPDPVLPREESPPKEQSSFEYDLLVLGGYCSPLSVWPCGSYTFGSINIFSSSFDEWCRFEPWGLTSDCMANCRPALEYTSSSAVCWRCPGSQSPCFSV